VTCQRLSNEVSLAIEGAVFSLLAIVGACEGPPAEEITVSQSRVGPSPIAHV
jgi:hypothetical protein